MGSRPDKVHRALDFMARVDEGAASEVRDWSFGTALITPQLPKVWDASYFRIENPRAADGEEVAEEATAIARDAGLAHAAVVVVDDETARTLGPGMGAAGFEESRFVIMALGNVPRAPEHEIVELSFAEVAESRRQLTLELFAGDEDLADQLQQLDHRLEATIGGRWFGVLQNGELTSRAWLLASDGVGQVEDVATSPSHRGTGLARAVVSAAARASHEAGNELTFVIANADETTPELYRKVGFEPLGYKRRYVKRLA